jgi:hypothetical protein
MALKRVWIPSPNYSSRGGASVRLIVVHTAEGARTIESLGSFFQGNVSASSQVGADDKQNTLGEYVKRSNKAWTQAEFNPVAVSIELCAFSAWSSADWDSHPNMLANCAAWIAEEAAQFGIPITKLSPSEAQGSGRGVCGHKDLGTRGGNHGDPGSNFPWDRVLDMARGGSASTSKREGDELISSCVAANGNFHVFEGDGKGLFYTWQREGENSWNGGQQGKSPAGWSKLATADADIVGVSAEVSKAGVMHVFVRCSNGKTYYTYQRPHENSWNGGEPGKSVAGLSLFAG